MRQTVDVERGTITLHADLPPAPVTLFCGWYPPPWHPSRWDWSRVITSLALGDRYAKLTPVQRRIHDVEALSAPSWLRRLMPAATRAAHADPVFVASADALLASLNSPTVRQEVERPTGAAAQPAVDPGSTPGGSDDYEPSGGVTSCWPCNGTGCDRCMPSVEAE